jgi:hypothetical protein
MKSQPLADEPARLELLHETQLSRKVVAKGEERMLRPAIGYGQSSGSLVTEAFSLPLISCHLCLYPIATTQLDSSSTIHVLLSTFAAAEILISSIGICLKARHSQLHVRMGRNVVIKPPHIGTAPR